jgi:transcriptional regulator with XRE-family HTH domain
MSAKANICGPAVARLRRMQGLTQGDLLVRCRAAGWPTARSTIAKVETRRRCVSDFELVALAAALGVKADRLLGRTRPKRRSHAGA